MLTQIRHIQKGLLIAVTIVIVIAFTFLYSDYDMTQKSLGSQDCAFRVYGKCYRLKEAQKLSNSMQVAMQFGMYDFAMDLFGRDRRDQDDTNFIMSLVILRKEASKLGIEPSFEEIQAEIPNLPALKAQPWMNEEIVTNALAANGFSMGDFQELVGDYLAWKKIKDLVSAGVQPVPAETERLYKAENQRYTVTVVDFDRTDFESKVNPSDEDIQKFYEQNTANLNSRPKRGFEMVTFTEGEQPEDATNEEKSNAALAFRKSVNKTYTNLAENTEKFAELAKAQQNGVSVNQVKFESIPPFEISEAPENLATEPNALRGLFSETRAVGSVTEPFQLSDGSVAVFKIAEEIPSKPLTLEESKEIIVEELKRRDSDKMANDAASEARQKLLDAIKAEKPFATAAKDVAVKTREVPNFSQVESPEGIEDSNAISAAVNGVQPGDLSRVIPKQDGSGYLLAFVDKIELYEDSSRESAEKILGSELNREDQTLLFESWFNQRRKEAGAERDPNRRIIEPSQPTT